jgi:hypothetical protein
VWVSGGIDDFVGGGTLVMTETESAAAVMKAAAAVRPGNGKQ